MNRDGLDAVLTSLRVDNLVVVGQQKILSHFFKYLRQVKNVLSCILEHLWREGSGLVVPEIRVLAHMLCYFFLLSILGLCPEVVKQQVV